MQALNEMLQTALWARALTAEELERVKSGIVVRTIPAGGFVCMKGEPVEHWMGVVDGLVKMAANWSSGKTTTFTGLSSGGWFGEGSMLKNEPRRYDVMALRESTVAYMNRATFQWLLDHSIPFNRFLITQLNERLGQFIGMMEHERLLDTDARLARCLARQRVNQALRKLEEAGLLRLDYGCVRLLDVEGLRRFGE
ncbi:MAG: Crp/Fnr family transcriptional regulator [Proteobacteria bacterium]|nr:Crp/Fnr family transcriptional regulator [Pseudomonadota bacterium]